MLRLLFEVVKRPIPCNFSYLQGWIGYFFRLFIYFFFLFNEYRYFHPSKAEVARECN